ncbi:hypothetical protein ACMFMG_004811 [Clarireedia jacksonii]
MGTEMVDLYIGKDEKHMRVHKRILCHKVPYFDKMFNSGFKEAEELGANSVEAFDVLLGWVYTNTLPALEMIDIPEKGIAMVPESWRTADVYFWRRSYVWRI